MQPGLVVSEVLLALIEASKAPANLDGEFIEALADHVHATRFGDGPEGLAAGQGVLVFVDDDLPAGVRDVADDCTVSLPRVGDASEQRLLILREAAAAVLGHVPRSSASDVAHLTLALAAPRAVVERLCRDGRPGPVALAAETGLPAWAAGARLWCR